MNQTTTLTRSTVVRAQSFFLLCKPRVTALIVFTAMIGMFLASPGIISLSVLLSATIGIALVTGAAAAFNCLIERKIDAVMARTHKRPLPSGDVNILETSLFASIIGGIGLMMLYHLVNPLTMWLTFLTFVGYAVIYTIFLKPATPMNIVIGGASGAMPPVLGWAAVNNVVGPESLILFSIIFVWTPPHFWSLALYRRKDYENSGLPMLPITHGEEFTRLHILLYTIMLVAVSLLPYTYGMSGLLYLGAVLLLDAGFMYYAIGIYRNYSDNLARKSFRYSIAYLTALFSALLIDHYFRIG